MGISLLGSLLSFLFFALLFDSEAKSLRVVGNSIFAHNIEMSKAELFILYVDLSDRAFYTIGEERFT